MGPAYGLHYLIAPMNDQNEFEVYSVVYRDHPNGERQTFRNSCGFFETKEQAENVVRLLNQKEE